MKTKFNFKSQICTSREQSERLITLGLKKETADCIWIDIYKDDWRVDANSWKECYSIIKEGFIPAWSLHRLLSLIEYDDGFADISIREGKYGIHYGYDDEWYDNLYDAVISCIETLIKEGHFSKKYLENNLTEMELVIKKQNE